MFRDLESIVNTEHNQSKRYHLVHSDEVIQRLIDRNWTVTSASERFVKKDQGKQFHIIKLEHPDLMIGDDPINLVYSNSHDGKSAARFRLGLFRLVCGNGLVVGNDLVPALSIPHNQTRIDEAINLVIGYMSVKAKDLADAVTIMKTTKLTQAFKKELAKRALKIKGFKEVNDIQVQTILDPNRPEDKGDTLWNVYNTIQESIEKGKYMLDEAGVGREIRSPVKKLDFNTKLFDAALRYAA